MIIPSLRDRVRVAAGRGIGAGICYVLGGMPPWMWNARFVGALGLLMPALLAVGRPPVYFLWKLSVPVREAGHWASAVCLLLGWEAVLAGPQAYPAGAIFFAAALLYGRTLARAFPVSRRAAREFREAWGEVPLPRRGFRRAVPLSLAEAFLGVPVPRAKAETRVYARKDGLDLRLDFQRAMNAGGPAPCVILFHGGGWDGGTRSQFPSLNAFLSAAGYAVADLDYRLAPRFAYPAPLEDGRDALRWLKERAGELGIDPERIILGGHSAGGQIALQSAYLDRDPSVRGAFAFYAPADMVLGYRFPCSPLILDSPRLMENYLGAGGELGLARAAEASPVERISPGAPPTLLFHGEPDVLVTPHHTARLGAKLERLGIRHFEVMLPWAPHGYDFVFRGPGSQISLYVLERFLASVLNRR